MSLDEAASVYRELSIIPDLISAQLNHHIKGTHIVSSIWKQRDIERNDHVIFSKSYIVVGGEDGHVDHTVSLRDATELNGVLLSAFSDCCKYKAVIRRITNKLHIPEEFLEIWSNNYKKVNINLTNRNKHGKIYIDEDIGCLNWSSNSNKLIYMAEKKRRNTTSFFNYEPHEETNDAPCKEELVKGDQYLFCDDWGEQYEGMCHPVVCIFDVTKETVDVLEDLPEGLSPAQAIFGADDKEIIFCGIYHGPYRLGYLWSSDRRSGIFHFDLLDGKCELLSANDSTCCRSPRCSPDRSKVVFLQNDFHKHCKRLMLLNVSTGLLSVLVDTVWRTTDDRQFPGIYTSNLPLRCFGSDNMSVYLHSQWRSTQKVLKVNISTNEVTVLSNDANYPAWTVYDVKGDMLLARRSAPNVSGQLVIANVFGSNVNWVVLEDNHMHFDDIDWKIFSDPRPDGLDVECILLKPQLEPCNRKRPMPLIVYPHGGPHLCSTAYYHVLLTFLCKMKFIILCVNYRGSSGFGQEFVLSLQGKIGVQDVKDVQQAVQHVIRQYNVNQQQVAVLGGSHGGFLALHLIGQYPDLYRACAMRNPVCNIADMFSSADIPDWCFVEVGLEWKYTNIPTSRTYEEMIKRSPVIYLPKIKAPTLFLVGKQDRRVPPKQSQDFYKKLKARGVKTKLLLYPQSHGLFRVDVEADSFINVYKWFQENLKI